MTKELLIRQVELVIKLLEEELESRAKGRGVYKNLLLKYNQAYSQLIGDASINDIRIIGSVRFFVDSSRDENKKLISEMGKAEDILQKLR